MAILAAAITMITHVAALSIGRVILGTSAGIMNVAFGKMVTETIPQQWVATFSMSLNTAVCFGFIIAYGLGAILPDPDNF